MATKTDGPQGEQTEDENLKLIAARVAAQATEEPVATQTIDEALAIADGPSSDITPYEPGERDLSEEMDRSDVKLPRLKLSQAMSAVATREEDPIPSGRWYNTQGNEDLGPEISIIPLRMFKHRSLFQNGVGLLCRSQDMVNGIGTPGIKCAECALQKWGKTDEGKSIPPKCRVNYNYPCIVVGQDGEPMLSVLTLASTGADTAKQINGIKEISLKDWERTTYRIGRKLTKNAQGTFYVPELVGKAPTEPEMLELAKNAMGLAGSSHIDNSDDDA